MGYSLNGSGIHVPDFQIHHRDDEYDSTSFDLLRDMQRRHFWYQGRHRFIHRALMEELGRRPAARNGLRAIDFGGGCGGWVDYLQTHATGVFKEVALADSSLRALQLAGTLVSGNASRYQIDLMRLNWENEWDVAFLLDVLEHIPNDSEALLQVGRALTPGGLLFVTTPALKCFWSYNDELAHHVRRYSKGQFAQLANAAGLRLVRAHYFMFFLSPLLRLSRFNRPDLEAMTEEDRHRLLARTHRVPAGPVNRVLQLIFDLETPLGLKIPFPWGTSILGVFEKAS